MEENVIKLNVNGTVIGVDTIGNGIYQIKTKNNSFTISRVAGEYGISVNFISHQELMIGYTGEARKRMYVSIAFEDLNEALGHVEGYFDAVMKIGGEL